jgi:hypothetical protein
MTDMTDDDDKAFEEIKAYLALSPEQRREQDLKEVVSDCYESLEQVQERFAVESFGHHEALDRASMMSDFFENALSKHPFILLHQDLYNQVDKIGDLIGELYQMIGGKE